MTQPTRYTRKYNATTHQALNPSTPQPGASLDAEFNAVKTTLDGTLDNLALIQRDDGALANGIVTTDSLASDLSLGFTSQGQWLIATAYAVDDVVFDAAVVYRCAVAHTSGTLATDVSAGKMVEIFDFASDLGFTPENAAEKGIADGYAGLDSSARLDVTAAPTRTLPRYVAVATTGGTTALTTDQLDNRVIKVTGTLASNAVLEVTTDNRQWFIWNATSGSFTLTVKTSAGTGVAITQGKWAVLYSDGTNVGNILGNLAPLDTVGTAQIDNGAVTEAKIGNLEVTGPKIGPGAVITEKIGNLEVTNAKVADTTLTFGKMAASALASEAQTIAGTASKLVQAVHMPAAVTALETPNLISDYSKVILRRKASLQSISSDTSLNTITDLPLWMLENETWEFEATIMASAVAAGGTPCFSVDGPASPGTVRFTVTRVGDKIGVASVHTAYNDVDLTQMSAAGDMLVNIAGKIINGSNAGSAVFQFRQATSVASNTTVKTNSRVTAWRTSA